MTSPQPVGESWSQKDVSKKTHKRKQEKKFEKKKTKLGWEGGLTLKKKRTKKW